ncbi:hypothetical protein FOZ63_032009, partial [Perkinsus olseni]
QVLGVRQGVQVGIRYYLPACELPENDEVRHIVDGIGELVVLRISDDSLVGDALNSGEPKQEPCCFDWIEAVEFVRRICDADQECVLTELPGDCTRSSRNMLSMGLAD